MAAPMPGAPSSVPLASLPPLKMSSPTRIKAVGSGSLRTLKVNTPMVCCLPLTTPVTVNVTFCPTAAGLAMYLPSPFGVSVPPAMERLILSGDTPLALTLTGFSKPA